MKTLDFSKKQGVKVITSMGDELIVYPVRVEMGQKKKFRERTEALNKKLESGQLPPEDFSLELMKLLVEGFDPEKFKGFTDGELNAISTELMEIVQNPSRTEDEKKTQ